jgi:signal transduction histidine kinase
VQFSGPLSVVDAVLADHAEAVVREAVSNTVRHAEATSIAISVSVGDDLCIDVIDDGCGIGDDITGSGLSNLHQRGPHRGGTLPVEPRAQGGTRLRWCAPLR